MKKLITLTPVVGIVMLFLFTACQKSSDEANSPLPPTLSTCKDTAMLKADSISCSTKNEFVILKNNKYITIAKGNAAIDSIVNNVYFIISYDSLGTETCGGIIYTKAALTCFKRI